MSESQIWCRRCVALSSVLPSRLLREPDIRHSYVFYSNSQIQQAGRNSRHRKARRTLWTISFVMATSCGGRVILSNIKPEHTMTCKVKKTMWLSGGVQSMDFCRVLCSVPQIELYHASVNRTSCEFLKTATIFNTRSSTRRYTAFLTKRRFLPLSTKLGN